MAAPVADTEKEKCRRHRSGYERDRQNLGRHGGEHGVGSKQVGAQGRVEKRGSLG